MDIETPLSEFIDQPSIFARALTTVLYVEPRVNVVEFWGRLLAFVGLSAWGVYFIFTDWTKESGPFREIGNAFMHRIDLVFHEAGHVLFRPLGDFMSVLGGSLGQLIMPAVVIGAFLLRYNNSFGAPVGSISMWLIRVQRSSRPGSYRRAIASPNRSRRWPRGGRKRIEGCGVSGRRWHPDLPEGFRTNETSEDDLRWKTRNSRYIGIGWRCGWQSP